MSKLDPSSFIFRIRCPERAACENTFLFSTASIIRIRPYYVMYVRLQKISKIFVYLFMPHFFKKIFVYATYIITFNYQKVLK